MRIPINRAQAEALGLPWWQLREYLTAGKWQKAAYGLYCEGEDPVTPEERALAVLVASSGVASHSFAALMHGFDAVQLQAPFVTIRAEQTSRRAGVRRHTYEDSELTVVNGVRCTTASRTLLDLGSVVGDSTLEQAIESALRMELTSIGELEAYLSMQGRIAGRSALKRVLARRPEGVPPTESLLETLAVQLIRENRLPDPVRQHEVLDDRGHFVARVDLAYPDLGVFIELDGQQHRGQPVYDAVRQTNVLISTGWIPARFTWKEVTCLPNATARRLGQLLRAASRRTSPF